MTLLMALLYYEFTDYKTISNAPFIHVCAPEKTDNRITQGIIIVNGSSSWELPVLTVQQEVAPKSTHVLRLLKIQGLANTGSWTREH